MYFFFHIYQNKTYFRFYLLSLEIINILYIKQGKRISKKELSKLGEFILPTIQKQNILYLENVYKIKI